MKSSNIKKSALDEKECLEWERKRNKNPRTGYKIKINGPTYKEIEKQCFQLLEKKIQKNRRYKLPIKELKFFDKNIITNQLLNLELKDII